MRQKLASEGTEGKGSSNATSCKQERIPNVIFLTNPSISHNIYSSRFFNCNYKFSFPLTCAIFKYPIKKCSQIAVRCRWQHEMKAPLRYNWFASQVETIINKIFSLNKHKYSHTAATATGRCSFHEIKGAGRGSKGKLNLIYDKFAMIYTLWTHIFSWCLSRSASSASAPASASSTGSW